MRVLELQSLDGPEGYAVAERPEPETDDGVVIDVRATGISFPDLLMSRGMYQHRPDLPFISGQDVAGIVRSAPAGAAVSPGDRVWAYPGMGGHAEVVTVTPELVFPLHDDLSFAQGAAIGSNFMTAVFALRHRARMADGETVLVLGAAGGLGTATIAVAKAYGGRVLASVSTPEKEAVAREAGADDVLVGEGWGDRARALTDGRGVDIVADIVGGDANLEGIRSLAVTGRLIILGFTTGSIPEIKANRLLLRNIDIVGAGLGAYAESRDPTIFAQCGQELVVLIAAGLHVSVGRTYRLAEAHEALAAIRDRTAQGKVVLEF